MVCGMVADCSLKFSPLSFSFFFLSFRPRQETEALQPGAPCGGQDTPSRGAVTQLHRITAHQEPAGLAHLSPELPCVPSR